MIALVNHKVWVIKVVRLSGISVQGSVRIPADVSLGLIIVLLEFAHIRSDVKPLAEGLVDVARIVSGSRTTASFLLGKRSYSTNSQTIGGFKIAAEIERVALQA